MVIFRRKTVFPSEWIFWGSNQTKTILSMRVIVRLAGIMIPSSGVDIPCFKNLDPCIILISDDQKFDISTYERLDLNTRT
jgi:hypothetical protein